MLLRGVRIRHVLEWSWEENACVVTIGDGTFRGPLPPFASPCALYVLWVNGEDRTIENWVHEPVTWSPVPTLDHLTEETLNAARSALRLQADAPRERILERVRAKDYQVVSSMGVWQGTFDGEGLNEDKRARLASNWFAFGRHEARCFSEPHTIVLATDADPPAVQASDFSRSNDPRLKRLALAAPAWRTIRRARLGGATLSSQAIIAVFGQIAYDILVSFGDTCAPRLLRTVDDWTTPRVVFAGESVKPEFSHAPGSAPDEVHWFASCIAVAGRHARKRFFMGPEVPKVGAYAVHERHGAVYVESAREAMATCFGGQEVTRGGLAFAAHPTAAEGGCELFGAGSVRNVGVYCPRGDGSTWSSSLVRLVLSLVSPGGRVHTNCVSTSFLTDASRC